jgi:hypothetical protein
VRFFDGRGASGVGRYLPLVRLSEVGVFVGWGFGDDGLVVAVAGVDSRDLTLVGLPEIGGIVGGGIGDGLVLVVRVEAATPAAMTARASTRVGVVGG